MSLVGEKIIVYFLIAEPTLQIYPCSQAAGEIFLSQKKLAFLAKNNFISHNHGPLVNAEVFSILAPYLSQPKKSLCTDKKEIVLIHAAVRFLGFCRVLFSKSTIYFK